MESVKVNLAGFSVPVKVSVGMSDTNFIIYNKCGGQLRIAIDNKLYGDIVTKWLGKLVDGDGLCKGGARILSAIRSLGIADEDISAITFNHRTGNKNLHYQYIKCVDVDVSPKHRRFIGNVTTKTAVKNGSVLILTIVNT